MKASEAAAVAAAERAVAQCAVEVAARAKVPPQYFWMTADGCCWLLMAACWLMIAFECFLLLLIARRWRRICRRPSGGRSN